jgi:hypothetical protein
VLLRNVTTRTVCGLILVLLLSGCAGSSPPADRADLKEQYRAAIEDAETAEPSEISTSLAPVTPYNTTLQRRPSPVDGEPAHVRVVTWTDAFGTSAAGDSLTTKSVIWVTLVPTLRAFCRYESLSGPALDVRLAQRLGLPPDGAYPRFVELWVRPADLRRPCPDPEITDRECELEPPRPSDTVRIDSAHTAWMERTRTESYTPAGYPWTRLGYTYDWNPATGEVGLSEYIVREEATVAVHSIASTDAYCRKP